MALADASVPGPLSDTPFEVPIISSESVFGGKIFGVRRERFSYNGGTLERDFVEHPGAVAIVAVDDRDRIAVVNQYRHPMRRRMWEIPAGLRDIPGEDPLAAAKRELAEETDLAASEWEHLIDFDTSPGGSNEALRVYLARGLTSARSRFEREAEESDMVVGWASVDDIVDGILARRLSNPSLIAGVLGYVAWRSRHGR